MYCLGAGIARYLGASIDWGIYILGQAWVTLIQVGVHYLGVCSTPTPGPADNDMPPVFLSAPASEKADKLPREVIFWAGIACLAVAASLTVLIIHSVGLDFTVYLIMLAVALAGFLYAVPLKRFPTGGYAELAMTVFVASLTPALALLLQAGKLHRLLGMATFPLAALYLAMLLALELPTYARDLKRSAGGAHTLMTRLGWQRGMLWHNYLLIGAFVILGVALVLGLPVKIGLPVFLVLPVVLLQIWLMHRIAAGARPNWALLSLTAIASFGLAAYLLTFTFWTR